MALPLTTSQDAYIDQMVLDFQAFKAALVASLKADNDPNHNIGDCRVRQLALVSAATVVASSVGGTSVCVNATGRLQRTPAFPRSNDDVYPAGPGLPAIP
jgi:hypothetical protein